MTKETFDYIWEQGILKAAKDVFDQLPDIIREEFEVEVDSSDETKLRLYQEYDKARIDVRNKYFNVGVNKENLIDSHKICACLTKALLRVRLIKFLGNNEKIPVEVKYSNYAVSFFSGVYVLYLFLLSDLENGDAELYKRLNSQATFYFPETNAGHDDYVTGRIKTLALNDLSGNDFDVLTYADMLFWIEKYNLAMLRGSIG